MPKKYTKQVWVNDSEPDLEADNLNHIENGIDNLDTRVAEIEDNGTASAISELKDVTLTSLSNGQILEYDSTSSKWKNTDGGGLVLANESVAQSVANIVESPFNFAIQNGVYGYIDNSVFCPLDKHIYSTTEQKVGKWINGSDVYEKTFVLTEIPSDSSWKTYSLGVTFTDVVSCNATYHIDLSSYSTSDVVMGLPFFDSASQYISYQINGNSFMIKFVSSEKAWRASGSYFKVVLRYIK